MTNLQKIEIARDFIEHHKKNVIQEWAAPQSEGGVSFAEDIILLHVFDKLEGGLYGEVRNDEEYDDDGEILNPATVYEIEIAGSDHWSGCPFIFWWDA